MGFKPPPPKKKCLLCCCVLLLSGPRRKHNSSVVVSEPLPSNARYVVRSKFHHPQGPSNTNSKRRNQPIQLPLWCSHQCTLVSTFQFVNFLSQLPHTVSEPLTNRGVLLSTLLQDILNPSHHLLNVLLQIANKFGLPEKKKVSHSLPGKRCICHYVYALEI
jgi:hypothetical protein